MKPLKILKKCSIASRKPAVEANNMSNAIEEDIFESMMHAKAMAVAVLTMIMIWCG